MTAPKLPQLLAVLALELALWACAHPRPKVCTMPVPSPTVDVSATPSSTGAIWCSEHPAVDCCAAPKSR